MRRTTILTRLCGGAAIVAVAAAVGLALVRHDARTPRWDVIELLGVAALAAGGWILACRAAPTVRVESSVPAQASIPRPLRRPPHDWGLAAGVVLTITTPLAVLWFGFTLYEGALTVFAAVAGTAFGFWLLVYVATDLLGRRLGPPEPTRRAVRCATRPAANARKRSPLPARSPSARRPQRRPPPPHPLPQPVSCPPNLPPYQDRTIAAPW
ncbi:hypothetical protein OG819_21980 [Streptomyces sp. NBC_01549]|nr:hypothetical protein [Streptomyces sp. NBC_01549]MCX4592299.1 hypothetical protein [Streptomyces sp. NBC_01549]